MTLSNATRFYYYFIRIRTNESRIAYYDPSLPAVLVASKKKISRKEYLERRIAVGSVFSSRKELRARARNDPRSTEFPSGGASLVNIIVT